MSELRKEHPNKTPRDYTWIRWPVVESVISGGVLTLSSILMWSELSNGRFGIQQISLVVIRFASSVVGL